jgi:replication factor C small subunit
MRKKINRLWMEKHRPQKLDEVVFQNDQQKKKFQGYIRDGEIPHLLFQGVQGSGKTTLSGVLVNELNVDPIDVLRINASKENNVETMREKISNFVQTFSIGPFKIVQLEEMDWLTPQAQGILRGIMEEYSDHVRFIGTCNYVNKIIPAIRSRFQEFYFKAPSMDETRILVGSILVNENVDFDMETLDKYVSVCYPDIRKLINTLDQNSIDGKLLINDTEAASDYKFQLLDLLETGNLRGVRKIVCENVGREEYEEVYRFLYENLHKAKGFTGEKLEEAIVLIANYLYKNALVADPEINFAALCIELGHL